MRRFVIERGFSALGALAVLSALSGSVEYTSEGLRDPFLSPFEMEMTATEGTAEVDLSGLNVQGMVWDSPMPQAIINERVVRQGDVIGGAEILDVQEEGVYILYEKKQYILRPSMSEK